MRKTSLCYLLRGDEVLLLHRIKKKNDENEGKWVGVGGKFLPGETPDQCVLREVLEETGLTLTSWHFHGVIHFLSDVWEDEDMYLYSADGFAGELTECTEGVLAWIPRERVLSLPLWEGDRYFLQPLMEGKQTISLTLRYEGERLAEVIDHGV